MLRVIHSQSQDGLIILSDIEDGVRFSSRIILDNAARLAAKQPVYVPYYNPDDPTQPGFVDLDETDKVLLSADHGCIAGLVDAGLATVEIFAAADILIPTIVSVELNDDVFVGGLVVIGTKLLSTLPFVSSLIITGDGAVTYTRAEVIAGGGTWTDTQIALPATLITGVVETTSEITVTADGLTVTPVVEVALGATTVPVVTTAVLSDGDDPNILTVTGTGFLSILPDTSSIIITGSGAVTISKADVLTGSGTWTDTEVVLPAALITDVAVGTSSVAIEADSETSTPATVITLGTPATPEITTAVLDTDLTITGSGFLSILPELSSAAITGDGAVTLTQSQVETGLGTWTDTSIVIPAALIAGVSATTSSVAVTADADTSSVTVITA
jgi:hypothetical protein